MPRIKLPSPGVSVAFVALLVALSGTAIALPGTGRVDSGDIKNGAVKSADIGQSQVRSRDIRNSGVFTQDIRNETVRSRDVFRNSLTGADINESTLDAVPTAVNAVNAQNAQNAANAGRAGSAAAVDTVRISSVVTASDGTTDVTVVEGHGWRVELDCDLAGDGAVLMLENIGAGDDSAVTNDADFTDVDQGEEVQILDESSADDPEGAAWQAIGTNGTLTAGSGAVINTPATGFGGADCVGSSTLIG